MSDSPILTVDSTGSYWRCLQCGQQFVSDPERHQCPALVDHRLAALEAQLATANEKARYCADETKQALEDIAAERERSAALAVRLRILRLDHDLYPSQEAWLRSNGFAELADALYSMDDPAVLAAHDAEVARKTLQRVLGKVNTIADEIAALMPEEGRG